MKLFVYGTLKYPEIVFALTGKVTDYSDVTLNGYKIVSLKNKPYPGLVISSDNAVVGKLIDINEESYAVISAWEDIEYTPIEVTANVGSDQVRAITFLHTVKAEQLSKDWNEEYFRNKHLKDYALNRIPKYLKTLTKK